MENGQKVNIPLDSGLDIKSSDMLVPVTQPKFQHNRQKYQGHYLPSSVRFELDGWAAGNDVYRFNINNVNVAAGSFTVSKQKINNNPTYKLIVKDNSKKTAGSLYYNSSSKLLSYNTDSAEVTPGLYPDVSGVINGKQFNLSYDSANGVFTDKTPSSRNIAISTSLKSNYTFDITVQDNAATVNISFNGMQLPSDQLYNTADEKKYLLGNFYAYSQNEGSIWQSGSYVFRLYDNGELHIENNGNVTDTAMLHISNNGLVTGSFNMTMRFTDEPQVVVQEFYPFFSDITATSTSKTVQSQADDIYEYNRWSYTIVDRDHINVNNRYNQDKLYRNIHVPAGITAEKLNKQTIEQFVPIWFGISARKGCYENIENNSVDIGTGGAYTRADFNVRGVYNPDIMDDKEEPEDYYDVNNRTVKVKCILAGDVLKYNDVVIRPNVCVWEGTVDKANDYLANVPGDISVRVNYDYYVQKWVNDKYDGGEVVVPAHFKLEKHSGDAVVKLDTTFAGVWYAEDLKDMFVPEVDDGSVIITSAKTITTATTLCYFDMNRSNFCMFRKNRYGQMESISNFSVDIATGNINRPQDIKGWMHAYDRWNNNTAFDDRWRGGGDNLSEDGMHFFACCCRGVVASSLYISSDKELTSQLDASYFSIKQVEPSDTDNYVDLSDLFVHSIAQASCNDNVSIYVYLCGKSTTQIMFYLPSKPDRNTYITPGHIIWGDKKKIGMSLTNSNDDELCNAMQNFIVNRSYSATVVDTNYGMRITVSGSPVRTKDDQLFSFIQSVRSVTDMSQLVVGNMFTDEVAADIVSNISWEVDKWEGWVDINTQDPQNYKFFKNYSQKMRLKIGDNTIGFVYNMSDDMPVPDKSSFTWTYAGKTYSISVAEKQMETAGQYIRPVQNMLIEYSTPVQYDLSFYKPYMFDRNFRLESLSENKAVFTQSNSNRLDIDFDTHNILLYIYNDSTGELGPAQECDEQWGANNSFRLTSEYIRTLSVMLAGVYKQSNVHVVSISQSGMTMDVNGERITVDMSVLMNPMFISTMDFLYTNVNKPKLEEKKFARLNTDDEMQLVKQQWDTTNETENFWWLSSEYVLVLTKREFIVRHKTDTLHDWDGDVFEDVMYVPRTDILSSSVLKYFCSSAYNGQYARLITVCNSNNSICICMYSFLDDNGKLLRSPDMVPVTVGLVRHQITANGDKLCSDVLNMHTYSEINTNNVISQAVWSATCIGSSIIIGCHYDCNFNQWAVVYNISTGAYYIVQGYGFVGVDGSLTGGEIPAKYFDPAVGFTGTVLPIDILSDTSRNIAALSELFTIEDKIVGTDAQQWYISSNIASIVSHLTFEGGMFVAHELPLNNNYSVDYDSASYASTVFSDYSLKIKSMRDLLPESNGVWTAMLILWANPMLYFLDPKISVANYLQQTLGQAAYVHYNSTSKYKKDVTKESVVDSPFDTNNGTDESVLYDEITFDRQSVKQTQKTSDPYTSTFTMCAAALVSALDWGQEKLQVNKKQNQGAVSDFGRKYSANFIQNMNSMSIADMGLTSVNPVQTIEVTAVKSLDMFYSTSDKQQVQAGPGYVNHNFIAQCVSQSVTALQSEFSQQKLLYIIAGLSLLPLQEINKALESAKEAVYVQMQSMQGPGFFIGGLAAGTSYTTPVAIALGIGYTALDIACNISRIGLELLPQILESLGGNKLNSSITARQSKRDYDIEAKHKYGSKSECFMWPCFGVDGRQTITDESVEVAIQNKSWKLSIPNKSPRSKIDSSQPQFVTEKPSDTLVNSFDGDVSYYIAMVKGKQNKVQLPEDMAYVIGTESFLSETEFKNENIGESEPVFPTPPFQDYIVDKNWQVSRTASVSMTTWISVKDTKVIDGELSNCVISDDFCGLASPYTAVEVKRGIQEQYIRPWAITPQVIVTNNTGLNCCFEEKAYHAFDGYGYRIVNWTGSPGMNKEHQTWLYSFLVNDRFKRSNKMPFNEFLGNFKSDPALANFGDYNDKVFTMITQPGEGKGIEAGTIGEDKDARRYAVPVFSEFVNTLPAAVKTVAVQELAVVDGITSLVTVNRDLQTAYKAPLSVDFTIGKNKYRYTQEYICSVENIEGVTLVKDIVPCLGLEFIGSTPYEAYLYSHATKQYYTFTGGSALQMVDMVERFRDVVNGRYDFVNQEVIMPCLATFMRLDSSVLDDDDETDNVIIPRLKDNSFIGEVWPPLDTVYNTRSWFRTLSLPCGVTYQGPNRCIINRFVLQDYMIGQVKDNYGLWKRVPREKYHPFRVYKAKYDTVDVPVGNEIEVKGWTHNPFLLVTAPLGVSDETDCMFEWELTFCWPVEMDRLYGPDNYAVVNIQAETMTPGGKVVAARPAHVYLTKDLFTRTGNYGYYSFRYQSKCGTGNRERLHIWSDQYICLSSLQCEYKVVTQKRTEILTEQLNVQGLREL